MKRIWIYAPKWVDYTVQIIDWLDKLISKLVQKLNLDYRWKLLDKYCKCKRCEERAKVKVSLV